MSHSAAHVPPAQISPPPQLVPSAPVVHDDVLAPGWHVWHAFAGFDVPLAYAIPAMKQPETQLALLQISPPPQVVPSASVVHDDVLVPGKQLWQALPGFTAPLV